MAVGGCKEGCFDKEELLCDEVAAVAGANVVAVVEEVVRVDCEPF